MVLLSKRSSRHLLPVNSMIFKSKSHGNLAAAAQQSNYGKYNKTTTTLPNISEYPDENLTALPPADKKLTFKLPLRKKAKVESLASQFQDPKELTADGLMNDKDKKPRGDAAWRRWIVKVKKSFKEYKDKKKSMRNDSPPPLIIGSPTDFRHVMTGGTEPLKDINGVNIAPVPPKTIYSLADFQQLQAGGTMPGQAM